MTAFENLVKDCFEGELNRDIENSAFEHAEILAIYLLKAAKKFSEDVRIVSGSLNTNFYEQLIPLIQDILNKRKVKVIVADCDVDLANNKFAELIETSPNGKLYYNANKHIKIPHFILVGKNKYRFETNHASTKAVGNFNNYRIGELLYDAFESYTNKVTLQHATP